ncbi:Pex19-domain-containing protein [Saccharata proteae CBS 121410]|uniref:Pex19-domain-containing protein n=1 Tax=Saccharata proteae CBS 121410 TaxID=1314787 RepID=A0A9P4HUC6_9PEZI|nr:Pex19-domain-containing protein [Saccharata proteae CBS 121410]
MAEKQPEKQDKPAQPVESIPDPDEDDLDDLDDVLDEFAATKIDSKPAAPSSSAPAVPAASTSAAAGAAASTEEDDFAQQLQAGMAELLGDLGNNTEMQKQFEDLMKELGDPSAPAPTGPAETTTQASSSEKAAPSSSKSAEDSFQETIRRTLGRMQESGEQASAAAASSDQDDILAQMLKEMEKGEFGGEGGDDEGFSKMLMGMMEQLTNKEILYEPMKELYDKFPGWMEKNKEKVSKEDLTRYEEQQQLVTEIVGKFEKPGYSDDSSADREYIVERMQKMQAAGSPPPDLVGDMSAAQEALGDIDNGCPTQ